MIEKAKWFNSGGGIIVYYGKLNNGLYFSYGEDTLIIFDDDYEHTRIEGLTDEWVEKHIVECIDVTDIYGKIGKAVTELIKEIKDTAEEEGVIR